MSQTLLLLPACKSIPLPISPTCVWFSSQPRISRPTYESALPAIPRSSNLRWSSCFSLPKTRNLLAGRFPLCLQRNQRALNSREILSAYFLGFAREHISLRLQLARPAVRIISIQQLGV